MSHFTSSPNRNEFNAQVWALVKQIPYGMVATYGQIAALIPPPPGMAEKDYRAWGARWVGGAMAACPEGVPWQRVVNSQGKISLRKGLSGPGAAPDASPYHTQRRLLEDEGVEFDERDRIDLKRFGWDGPGSSPGPIQTKMDLF